jgi:hypothetical protein
MKLLFAMFKFLTECLNSFTLFSYMYQKDNVPFPEVQINLVSIEILFTFWFISKTHLG